MWRRSILGAVNRPFVAAGGAPFALDWVGDNNSSADSTTYTYSSEPVGTAATGRRVLVGVFGRSTAGAQTISSVTVAGNAATAESAATQWSGGAHNIIGIYYRDESSGATADIVSTFSNTQIRSAIDVANVIGFGAGQDVQANTGTSATTVSITLTIPAGGKGYVFAFTSATSTLGITGTGVTQNATQALEFGLSRSAILGTPGSITVTATAGAASDIGLIGVAYGPA